MREPTRPKPVVLGGDPVRGQALYGPCVGCHGLRGEGNPETFGSPLVYISDWYLLEQLKKFKLGIRGADPRDPVAIMMRPMALTLTDEQAMKDIVAYLSTLND